MRGAKTQTNNLPNSYTGYIQFLNNEGYNREQINIDENSEVVTTRSLSKGTTGKIIDIRCPCSYIISIAGREQSPENAHVLTVRLTNKDNVEISPDTRIKIIKEKVSQAIAVIDYYFYKDVCMTEFIKEKDLPNEIKECDNLFRFNNSIELNGEEHLQIYAINPDIDIDASHINLSLDIDLWEQE